MSVQSKILLRTWLKQAISISPEFGRELNNRKLPSLIPELDACDFPTLSKMMGCFLGLKSSALLPPGTLIIANPSWGYAKQFAEEAKALGYPVQVGHPVYGFTTKAEFQVITNDPMVSRSIVAELRPILVGMRPKPTSTAEVIVRMEEPAIPAEDIPVTDAASLLDRLNQQD